MSGLMDGGKNACHGIMFTVFGGDAHIIDADPGGQRMFGFAKLTPLICKAEIFQDLFHQFALFICVK